MITDVTQRWRARRTSYRPAGEVIDPRHYEVAPIAADAVARAFVVQHHYSASYPAARERVGLYQGGELVGVAVFSEPCRSPLTDRKRVHVDHDHRTDRVRGILCIGCNSGLGKLGDSKDGLERAWRYLDAAARAKPRRADTRRQQRRAEDQTWDWSI